ncbi:LysR family transcriptional regulator [Prosthecomicrobium pneumaticum]|uniref:DNA-binding transcriptional LysR family regulator n=1 Tax=Prosthecomicrobium pneumaticum TaxID=81895 RepID=A0A7W9CVJ3_9HYPH|nr:LysR family transcriptional regulator [Prosthecomicrobium pneumaticum]MBB5752301.1 DNA-binding transcriptional LysR family regulator [Prosthecomicrobium pneumaticum]
MLDRLTLDQLRVFVAVVETGSFSGAARQLRRVQSAVSQAMQTLEETLGVALFDRAGRTPKVTEAGAALVVDARAILRDAERLKDKARAITEDIEPSLPVAIDPILSPTVIVGALRRFSRTFPDVPLTVMTEPLAGPERRLRDGDVRLAFHSWPMGGDLDVERRFLVGYPMIPVVAMNHPLAREAEPVPRAVLERHRQLVMTDGRPTQPAASVISRDVWRFIDMPTRVSFLFAGFGWCNMPVHLVARAIASGRLKAIATENRQSFEIPISAVNLVSRPLGRAGRWLVDEMERQIRAELEALPHLLPGVCEAVRLGGRDAAPPVG